MDNLSLTVTYFPSAEAATKGRMTKKFTRALFVFRRDLRLVDNSGLNQALLEAEEVIPAFIFDPRQINDNPFRSEAAVQFMLTSITELQDQLAQIGGSLNLLWGIPDEILTAIVRSNEIEAVYCNKDYTPFSLERDSAIELGLSLIGCKFFSLDDALLIPPGGVIKSDGSPYTVYTPFLKKARSSAIPKPQPRTNQKLSARRVSSTPDTELFDRVRLCSSNNLIVLGGREQGLSILDQLGHLTNYRESRDLPAQPGTSRLSAHLKFGTVSAREVCARVTDLFGENHALVNQLFWRDFFTQIAFYFPHVYRTAFQSRYDKLEWDDDPVKFKLWTDGLTGFPIVDAGMRELNQTGFMHNRVRMIVASFLVKDLHICYRWGERYFASKLVDYDPAVNNGNWQWAASTGCDAQPYFRIFNPWLQQAKFDPECSYIKRWVPELKDLSVKTINSLNSERPSRLEYPEPIVEHAFEKDVAIERYRAVRDIYST